MKFDTSHHLTCSRSHTEKDSEQTKIGAPSHQLSRRTHCRRILKLIRSSKALQRDRAKSNKKTLQSRNHPCLWRLQVLGSSENMKSCFVKFCYHTQILPQCLRVANVHMGKTAYHCYRLQEYNQDSRKQSALKTFTKNLI